MKSDLPPGGLLPLHHEAAVEPVNSNQLAMGALLNDLTMIDHNNLVGMAHGFQPVSNHDDRLIVGQFRNGLHQLLFIFGVNIGSGLVQNDDWRVLQHGPGNGDALPFAAGEVSAGCAAYGLIAVLQPHYELVAAAFLRGVNDLRIGRTLSAHADVAYNRKVKKVIILRHIGDALRALRQRKCTDVHAAQLNCAVLYIPQGGNKPGDGGLAAAGGAYKGIDRPRGNVQIDFVQHLLVVIGKADIFSSMALSAGNLSTVLGRCISSPDSTSAISSTMVLTWAMSSV